VLAFWCSNLIVYWSGWDIVWKLMVSVLIGFVLLGVFHVTGAARQPLDFKSGASWLLPWLVGTTVISYLGSYGTGARGVIGFGWSIAILFALSVIVYAIAVATRLDRDEAQRHIASSQEESKVEEETMGATP
jgi:hypothetical protein